MDALTHMPDLHPLMKFLAIYSPPKTNMGMAVASVDTHTPFFLFRGVLAAAG